MKIPITIGWRLAKRYNYFDNYGCPLFHALKQAGVDVSAVCGSTFLVNGTVYRIDAPWDTAVQSHVIHSHESAKFYLDTEQKALVACNE